MPPRILLTGAPGSGKSTLAAAVIRAARARGWRIAGIVSPEIRRNGRTGFRIIDLASSDERLMASVGSKSEHRVGKYGVDVAAVDEVARRFERSIGRADLLVIDEIGKMELFSAEFARAVEAAFAADLPLVAVVHRSLVPQYAARGEVVEVSRGQLDALERTVLGRLDRETAGAHRQP
ncbi:MAG: DUF2478 domain-containing protein [Myxococcales bacterium]|nr:DUF2478 domain-containing protein [Myxococcales bacterium]